MIQISVSILVHLVIVDAEGLHIGESSTLTKLEIIVLGVHALPLKLVRAENLST